MSKQLHIHCNIGVLTLTLTKVNYKSLNVISQYVQSHFP
ncbi:hypothetical protein SSCHL_0750 [Staphylococcus schleiferi]|nr:hypothetical protein SSCHL_0750 [Staphylococcus schleiferi]